MSVVHFFTSIFVLLGPWATLVAGSAIFLVSKPLFDRLRSWPSRRFAGFVRDVRKLRDLNLPGVDDPRWIFFYEKMWIEDENKKTIVKIFRGGEVFVGDYLKWKNKVASRFYQRARKHYEDREIAKDLAAVRALNPKPSDDKSPFRA